MLYDGGVSEARSSFLGGSLRLRQGLSALIVFNLKLNHLLGADSDAYCGCFPHACKKVHPRVLRGVLTGFLSALLPGVADFRGVLARQVTIPQIYESRLRIRDLQCSSAHLIISAETGRILNIPLTAAQIWIVSQTWSCAQRTPVGFTKLSIK